MAKHGDHREQSTSNADERSRGYTVTSQEGSTARPAEKPPLVKMGSVPDTEIDSSKWWTFHNL